MAQLGALLDAHAGILWVRFPDDGARWYAVPTARERIPAAHLATEVLITQRPGLDGGTFWLEELATGYSWALTHDRATPCRPHPWPWPPLAQRAC
jgi:hypothetical protein